MAKSTVTEAQLKILIELAKFGRISSSHNAGKTVCAALERKGLVQWRGQWRITAAGEDEAKASAPWAWRSLP